MIGIYARTSSDGQAEDKTIEQQINAGIIFANNQNEPYLVFKDDAISGASDDISKRPALMDLLDAVKRKDISSVWVWEQSRIARNSFAAAVIFQTFLKANIVLYVGNKKFKLDDPADKLNFSILSAISEYERQLIFARTKRGLDTLVDKGHKQCNSLYGYRKSDRDDVTGRRVWSPVKDEIDTLRYFYGQLLKGKSLQSVLMQIDPTLRQSDDRRWRDISNWGKRLRIFEYTGWTHNKKGEEIPCINFPIEIVTRKDWRNVVAAIDSRMLNIRQRRQSEQSTGLITCYKCSAKYYHKATTERRNKSGLTIYHYYFHWAKSCGQMPRYLQQDLIDTIFDFLYRFSLRNQQDLDLVREELESAKANASKDKEDLINIIDAKISAANKKIGYIKKAIMNGVEDVTFIDDLKQLQSEIKSLEADKKSNNKLTASIDDSIQTILKEYTLEKLIEWEEGEPRDKRQILAGFCESYIMDYKLIVRVRKTNRIHDFDLKTTTIESIKELSKMQIEKLETLVTSFDSGLQKIIIDPAFGSNISGNSNLIKRIEIITQITNKNVLTPKYYDWTKQQA